MRRGGEAGDGGEVGQLVSEKEDNLQPELTARPRRGKLEGFQRINMVGFTARLECFGRAKRAQERNWRSVEEVVLDGES